MAVKMQVEIDPIDAIYEIAKNLNPSQLKAMALAITNAHSPLASEYFNELKRALETTETKPRRGEDYPRERNIVRKAREMDSIENSRTDRIGGKALSDYISAIQQNAKHSALHADPHKIERLFKSHYWREVVEEGFKRWHSAIVNLFTAEMEDHFEYVAKDTFTLFSRENVKKLNPLDYLTFMSIMDYYFKGAFRALTKNRTIIEQYVGTNALINAEDFLSIYTFKTSFTVPKVAKGYGEISWMWGKYFQFDVAETLELHNDIFQRTTMHFALADEFVDGVFNLPENKLWNISENKFFVTATRPMMILKRTTTMGFYHVKHVQTKESGRDYSHLHNSGVWANKVHLAYGTVNYEDAMAIVRNNPLPNN